jgi:hypothetical protein
MLVNRKQKRRMKKTPVIGPRVGGGIFSTLKGYLGQAMPFVKPIADDFINTGKLPSSIPGLPGPPAVQPVDQKGSKSLEPKAEKFSERTP